MSKKARQQKKLRRQQDKIREQEKRTKANEAAAAAIKAFLNVSANSKLLDSPAWHLHVLCRTGDSEETFGYQSYELEAYQHFHEKLISFFLRSDNAKRFNRHIGNNYELGERLSSLVSYFEALIHSSQVKAELDLIDADHFADMSEEKCRDKVWYYQREEKLLRAKNGILLNNKPISLAA